MGSNFVMMKKVIFILLAIALVIGGALVVSVIIWAEGLSDDYDKQRYSILVEVDHVSLVETCREMLENKDVFGFYADQVQNRYRPAVYLELYDPNMPEIIRNLEAAYVRLCEDHVYICVGCGFEHIAVAVYAEGVDNSSGCKMAEGMWYYDDFFDGTPLELQVFIADLKRRMEK